MTHSVSAHDNNPSTPAAYTLPFDPNRLAKITDAPNEGHHGVDPGYEISREAIDFVYVASDIWSAVRAAKVGTVIYKANPQFGYGNTVVIDHDAGFFSYYEHLASFNPGMSLFTSVPKGYQVGIIGGTPDVPIHLHFEIRDGVQTNPINIRTTEDSRGHSYIRTKIYRRIGLFPWYPNEDMNSGFVPRSTSHPVGVCLRNRVLVMRWLAPNEFDHNEDGAGNADRFQGYDWELSMVNSTVPQGPNPKPGSATSSGITFNNLADGNYWFHLRAYSSFYGWAPETSVSHIGPFKINSNCPHSPSESDWLADPD